LECEQNLANATDNDDIQKYEQALEKWHEALAKWEGKLQVHELIELCTQRLRQLEQKIQSADATDADEAENIATYKLRIPMWQEYLASHQSKFGGTVGNVAPSANNHVRLTPAGLNALRTVVAQAMLASTSADGV
jgi:hypothetical protein